MSDEFDAITETMTALMIEHFRTADALNQANMLHAHLEQLHLLCKYAKDGTLEALAEQLMQATSSASRTGAICQHCEKAARLLAEYLTTMRANNEFHRS